MTALVVGVPDVEVEHADATIPLVEAATARQGLQSGSRGGPGPRARTSAPPMLLPAQCGGQTSTPELKSYQCAVLPTAETDIRAEALACRKIALRVVTEAQLRRGLPSVPS